MPRVYYAIAWLANDNGLDVAMRIQRLSGGGVEMLTTLTFLRGRLKWTVARLRNAWVGQDSARLAGHPHGRGQVVGGILAMKALASVEWQVFHDVIKMSLAPVRAKRVRPVRHFYHTFINSTTHVPILLLHVPIPLYM